MPGGCSHNFACRSVSLHGWESGLARPWVGMCIPAACLCGSPGALPGGQALPLLLLLLLLLLVVLLLKECLLGVGAAPCHGRAWR